MIIGKVNGKDVYFSENTKQWQYKGNNKPVKTEKPITTVESTVCRCDNDYIECDGTTDYIEEDVDNSLVGKIKRFFKL